LCRHGDFWFREYHDRYIRGRRHFDACRDYIENNPVEAGLAGSPEAWRWSSAMVQKGRTAGGTPAVPGVAKDLGDSAGGTPAVPAVAEDPGDRAGGTPAVSAVAEDLGDSAGGTPAVPGRGEDDASQGLWRDPERRQGGGHLFLHPSCRMLQSSE